VEHDVGRGALVKKRAKHADKQTRSDLRDIEKYAQEKFQWIGKWIRLELDEGRRAEGFVFTFDPLTRAVLLLRVRLRLSLSLCLLRFLRQE
jgi:hypothetical protein